MFNAKFICTIFAFIAIILSICNINKQNTVEGLGMLPSFVVKPQRVMAANKEEAEKGRFWSVPGTYQSSLSPRFNNQDVGANIRYNVPSNKNLAVPTDPLTFSNMAKENYVSPAKQNCNDEPNNVDSYKGGAPIMEGGFAAGNFNDLLQDTYKDFPQVQSQIPVGDMTTVNDAGDTENPIIYDRYIFANRNYRLRSLGDMIRGDLPIVPNKTGWFNVSANPNTDLNQGALNVMGGLDNSTAKAMATLMAQHTGETTVGGINMTQQQLSSLGVDGGVQVAAFP